MKSLAETRTLLLSQHDQIRDQIAAALRAFSSDRVDQPALKQVLDRLVVSLAEHNATEEEALNTVLPDLDAFGTVRKEVMLSDHRAEHQELHSTLMAAGDGTDPQSIARISAMLDRLLGHMEHEENLFLNPKLFE